jgi:glycosyltransferase involved in cell wall biosynthesis
VPKLVSVVIPVYNAASYLEECLNSILGQDYEQLELIVINDGSPDDSEEIIRKYAAKDHRIKPFAQKNHGLGYTRNRGISLSSGEYVFFLDSDDLVPSGAIKTLVESAESVNADYAVGKVLRLTEERRYVPVRHKEFNLYEKNEATTLLEHPELLQDSIACNKLWRRDFLIKHGLNFTVGKYYEDLAFTLKGAVLADKIAVSSKPVYLWRVREGEDSPSITQQQMKLENTRDRLNALLQNRRWLAETGANDRIAAEHDLKALLDVLRLHAIKYELVPPQERAEWEQMVLSFLKQIPERTAERLPHKEKLLYEMLTKGHFRDLQLFSQMHTNTEASPIVRQEGIRFILHGEQQQYDVTSFLKPVIVIKRITTDSSKWFLEGELTVPKASMAVNGMLYATSRESPSSNIRLAFSAEPQGNGCVYPFERQMITFEVDPSLFPLEENGVVYDFYYSLGETGQHLPARVRVHPSAKSPSSIRDRLFQSYVYRTNNGNLSLQRQKLSAKKLLKKLIKKLL